MVIGKGLLGNAFKEYQKQDPFIFFCSGVSNSTSKNQIDFSREFELLKSMVYRNYGRKMIYFSTCSIYELSLTPTPYVAHKLSIERFIIENFPSYIIYRLSNVVGSTSNNFTIMNFLVYSIINKIPFEVWKFAHRNFIDIDDVFRIVSFSLENDLFSNQIVNVANSQSTSVLCLVHKIETFFKTSGVFKLIEKGSNFSIDIKEITPIIKQLKIDFENNYIERLLEKYYNE